MISVSKPPFLLYILLFFTTFALRAAAFGTPFFAPDEQFYLLVGGRILIGDLPFVDVWDRKPIGIFFLYTLFHLFGSYRFLAYQIGATISAALTAIIVMRSAHLVAPLSGALIAAFFYLGWINVAHGGGGQSPVFYNLPVAYALYLVMQSVGSSNRTNLNTLGLKVMALFGIALQIKYTVVFEGIFAGLYLSFARYRQTQHYLSVVKSMALWVGMALLPTLLVFSFYIATGHGHAWWFANVQSIFLRSKQTALSSKIYMAEISTLLFIPLIHYITKLRNITEREYIVILWSLTSWLGVIVLESYFKHYVLPLFVPFAVALAPLWTSRSGKIYLITATILGLILGEKTLIHSSHKEKSSLLYTVEHYIHAQPGCVFVYDGPSSLQDIRPYCHLTPYLFPGHLNEQREKNALGVNQLDELKHVLAQKPRYIIDSVPHDTVHDMDSQSENFFRRTIHASYHILYDPIPTRQADRVILYQRNP